MFANTIFKYLRKGWPFLLSVIVFITIRFALRNPDLVEKYYSNGIYPVIAKLFSSVSKILPFSLWDVFWTGVILILISGLILVIIKKIRFGWYCMRIAWFIALGYSFFYLLWGFNYFRPSIESRIGWNSPAVDEKIFHSILDTLIAYTNDNHISVAKADYSSIDLNVEKMYSQKSRELHLHYPNGSRAPKKMLFSSFFTKLGVSGYFGPYFNEVHVNNCLLPMEYPFVLAHEKAHQFGICNEAEANLAAYIVCAYSEDMRLRYSAYMYMLLYFLSDAQKMEGYKEYVSKIDNAVLQDLRYRYSYYEELQNETLDKMQTATNDLYLKSMHIKDGVMNYNQVVSLVIRFYQNKNMIE